MAKEVTAGQSLNSPAIKAAQKYSIYCILEVENWTPYDMTEASVSVVGGQLPLSVSEIQSGKREGMAGHKRGYGTSGTYGVASWLIKEWNRRVYVMWDVPHNLIMPQDNRLAVGISAPGETSHENVYKEMFEGRGLGDSRIKYRCRVFQKELSPIECSDDKMVVTGSIGGDCRTTAKISVKPQRLAKSPQTEHSYSDRE